MDNLLDPTVRTCIRLGHLVTPYRVDAPLPLIAVDDIGAITAKVFSAPDQHIGQVLPLVADVASVRQISALIESATGRPVAARQLPDYLTGLLFGADLKELFRWAERRGATIPFDATLLRSIHPGLSSIREWVAQHFS